MRRAWRVVLHHPYMVQIRVAIIPLEGDDVAALERGIGRR
jgi:hypothetical protein